MLSEEPGAEAKGRRSVSGPEGIEMGNMGGSVSSSGSENSGGSTEFFDVPSYENQEVSLIGLKLDQ